MTDGKPLSTKQRWIHQKIQTIDTTVSKGHSKVVFLTAGTSEQLSQGRRAESRLDGKLTPCHVPSSSFGWMHHTPCVLRLIRNGNRRDWVAQRITEVEGETGKRGKHEEKKGGRGVLDWFNLLWSKKNWGPKGKREKKSCHSCPSRISNFEKSCYFPHRWTLWSSEQTQPAGLAQVRFLILSFPRPPTS